MKIDIKVIQNVIAQAVQNHLAQFEDCLSVYEEDDELFIKTKEGEEFRISVTENTYASDFFDSDEN